MKRFLGRQGRGSIELLLIIMSVLGMAFLFSTAYLSTQDATVALVIAKNGVTEKLHLHETTAIIESIRYTKSGDGITLRVFTEPASVGLPLTDLRSIEDKIRQRTPFASVTIEMNPNPVP